MEEDINIFIIVFSIEIKSSSEKFSLGIDSHISPKVFMEVILNSISFESHALHRVVIKFGHSRFLIHIFSIVATSTLAEFLIPFNLLPNKLKELNCT